MYVHKLNCHVLYYNKYLNLLLLLLCSSACTAVITLCVIYIMLVFFYNICVNYVNIKYLQYFICLLVTSYFH
jgi:hypothetical protein